MKQTGIRSRVRTSKSAPQGSAAWEQMFKVLEYFHRAHGHCRVRSSTARDSLAYWLDRQRAEAAGERLDPKLKKRLEALGVDFAGPSGRVSKRRVKAERPRDERWEKRFAELVAFKTLHGHCRVPRRGKFMRVLGVWLGAQRQAANGGRLRADRLERLKNLGMELGRTDHHRWNAKLAELQAYRKRFGHCDVPCHWSEYPSLGVWVSNQRSFRRRGILSEERIQRLDQLDFGWSLQVRGTAPAKPGRDHAKALDEHWDYMFAALLDYKQEHGDCNVRPNDGMEGRLYKWVTARRTESRKGWLREDRRERLEEIGFLWNGHNPQWGAWDKKFAQLVAYRNQHGHCDVPCHWDEDRSFGHWVSNQRSFRIKGKLSQDRIDRLDSIGFKWFARLDGVLPSESFDAHAKGLEQLWDLMFAELARFKAEYGHYRIPKNETRWQRLYRWIQHQRKNWKAGELSEARQHRLQEVGFEREPYNPSWDLKFNQLIEYKKRFGHCEVPARWSENTPLGLWAHNQRAFKRKGQLSSERIQRLENIGFAWTASPAGASQP